MKVREAFDADIGNVTIKKSQRKKAPRRRSSDIVKATAGDNIQGTPLIFVTFDGILPDREM